MWDFYELENDVEKVIDSIGSGFKTFRDTLKGFFVTVLKDIRTTLLKEQIADPIKKAVSTIGDKVLGRLKGAGAGNAGDAKDKDGKPVADPLDDVMKYMKPVWDKAKDMFANLQTVGTNMFDNLFGPAGLLSGLWQNFMSSFSGGGSSGGIGGLFGTVLSAVGIGGGSNAASSLTASTTKLADAPMGVQFDAVPAAFANGGIMTNSGSMPLMKYAMGGIANKPQLALFGEGRMNEAYVPLPDGRTIPVTLSGAGGGGSGPVQVNIVINNQTGDTKTNSSGDEKDIWTSLGNRIKSVVVETLVVEQRPGGLLYR